MPVDWEYRIDPKSSEVDRFTPAQLEIIRELANGKTAKTIAELTHRHHQVIKKLTYGHGPKGNSKSRLGIVGIVKELGYPRSIVASVIYAITTGLLVDQE